MPKRFTGFSQYYHDSALTTINEDGTIAFASHAERFSKKKNDFIIPQSLWDYRRDDDHLSFYEDEDYKEKIRYASGGRKLDLWQFHPEYHSFTPHHVSHCAGAFYTRPWKDRDSTVMVSIDGVGEHQTAVILDNNFNLIKEWVYPKSVGLVYTDCTTALGLRPLEDEYVVMGLSSYGEVHQPMLRWLKGWYDNIPNTTDDIKEIAEDELVHIDFGTSGRVNGPKSTRIHYRADLKGKFKAVLKDGTVSREDLAATVQEFADWAIMDIMREARKYGKKLVYSGGCAQNVVINSRLPELFDEVHIAISPTDAGSSLGCAAHSWSQHTGKDQLIWTPYLGYNIDREVNPKEVVDHLLEHKVCGLANGRAEFGPRALGNRSLIADVRYDVKETVNTIKRRQQYRPFAPAILEEYADQYFEGPMNEYMQYTAIANHDYKSVTHVDGTARVQIVKKDCESVFRKVIEEYYERTGVPMLLNTSLNIRGRPMVNDEHDAKLWEQKYNVKVF
jgi:carbamoyltransferase